MEEGKRLCEEMNHRMGEEDWRPLCEHVKKLETECNARDARVDKAVDPIIVSLGDVGSDDKGSSEEDRTDGETDGIALITRSNG
jgi:hypothetical protein